MTLTERLADPRRTPDNVIPFDQPRERRSKPRWIKRMEQQGLPVQDSTSRIFGAYVPTGSDGAA